MARADTKKTIDKDFKNGDILTDGWFFVIYKCSLLDKGIIYPYIVIFNEDLGLPEIYKTNFPFIYKEFYHIVSDKEKELFINTLNRLGYTFNIKTENLEKIKQEILISKNEWECIKNLDSADMSVIERIQKKFEYYEYEKNVTNEEICEIKKDIDKLKKIIYNFK